MKKPIKHKAKPVRHSLFKTGTITENCPDCGAALPPPANCNVGKVVRCKGCRTAHRRLMQIIRRRCLKKKKR